MKLVQTAEPQNAGEVVDTTALTATIKVTSYPVKAITETANTDIAFGAKAVYTAEQPTLDTKMKVISGKGKIDLSGYNFDKAIDYMRAHGFIGKTDASYNDFFRLHYLADQQKYHVELARSTDIDHTNTPRIIGDTVTAKVVNTATGAFVTTTDGIPRQGQTVTLDFGEELGKIVIICDGSYDFAESDFKGNTNCGYFIKVNAPHKNGGTINFTNLVKTKLAKAARVAGAAVDKDITLQWNTDHLELISDGKVVGQTKTMTLSGNDEITPEFFTNPADNTTSLGTVTITPGGDAQLNEYSFMNYTDDSTSAKTVESFSSGLTYRGYDTKKQESTINITGEKGVVHVPGQPGVGEPGEPGEPGTPDQIIPGRPPTPEVPPTPDTIIPGGHGLILQIGDTSEPYDRMEIIIDDMHTNAMGIRDKDGRQTAKISDVDIGTQSGAQDAIAVIKGAINYVSSVRGDLGAYQNRLEHTGNNLSVSVENIQDAESTIRDTDMAEEIMGYVKHNLFLQYSQAMLAQANVLPEGVLQLLG